MSRTIESDSVRDALLTSLRSQGASVETMASLASDTTTSTVRSLFERLGHAGREVYFVRGLGLINVHVRSQSPGWWNILKTVKNDLDTLHGELGIARFFVLLIGRPDRFIADGYIITEFDQPPLMRDPSVERTKYTINEMPHLDQSRKLLSLDKVTKALLSNIRRNNET